MKIYLHICLSFFLGFLITVLLVGLTGYRVYLPISKMQYFPLTEVIYLEEIDARYKPEAFTREEKNHLLHHLKSAKAYYLFNKSKNPPDSFFSENLEGPRYAIKAVIPFNFPYFLFDENGLLIGAQLQKSEAECIRKIILNAVARQKSQILF